MRWVRSNFNSLESIQERESIPVQALATIVAVYSQTAWHTGAIEVTETQSLDIEAVSMSET